jgi:hypothetical protein
MMVHSRATELGESVRHDMIRDESELTAGTAIRILHRYQPVHRLQGL